MKIGLTASLQLFAMPPGDALRIAQRAEEVGFESIWIPDHPVIPVAVPPQYPYSDSGVPPFDNNMPWLEPTTMLTFLAAGTTTLGLGTGIYIVPLRNPHLLARTLATVDWLSNGRLLLGVGVGWMPNEAAATETNFENRGKRTEEILQILKKLWTEEEVEFSGEFYTFEKVKLNPKPVRKPHPPILYGGHTPVALRRAAQLCDGWIGMGYTPDQLPAYLEKLNELRKKHGREGLPFDITVTPAVAPTLDVVKRFEELGVSRLKLTPYGRTEDPKVALEGIDRFGDEVLAKL